MKKYNIISGTSFGAIAAGMLSHGMTYDYIRKMMIAFPGDRAMRNFNEWSRGTIWFKIAHFITLEIKLRRTYKQWVPFFRKHFSWDRVTHANDVWLCFADTADLASLSGLKKEYTYLDLIDYIFEKSKDIPIDKLAQIITPKYATNHGIYEFKLGEMRKISDVVIPMADAILASFSNPLLGKFELNYGGRMHKTFDGGIVNNHANLPLMGREYLQLICDTAEPSRDIYSERFILSAYNYWQTKPASIWFLPPKEHDKPFFDFPNEKIRYEFDGRGVEHYGYNFLTIPDNLAICGGASDGLGYAPFFRSNDG